MNQLIRSSTASRLLGKQLAPASILSRYSLARIIIPYATRNFTTYSHLRQTQSTFKPALAPPSQASQLPSPPQLQSLPPITKATLLSQTNSKLARLLIHLKWPLLRNTKTSTLDVVSAFISWLVMGNLLWIILGTTTFALMSMYSIHYFDELYEKFNDGKEKEKGGKDNSILGYIAGSILSFGLGIKIQFEKGSILPELKDGKLRFNNVSVTSDKNSKLAIDAKVEALDVTLSFNKWYEGNGLIYDMEIFGLNGKVYRKSEQEQANPPSPHESLNLSYKNHDLHYQYDLMEEEEVRTPSLLDYNYQLEHVLIHDSYLEIYDESEVPLCINIFNCELPQLRGDKVLIDFFNANNASGTINNSMFTIHKRQRDEVTEDRIVRFKLDAIDLGEISKNNPQSKFNWLVNGKVQVIADIKLPNLQETEEYTKLASIISRFINDFSITSTVEPDDSSLLKDAISAIYHTFNKPEQTQLSTSPYVLINVKVKLTDLKASVPKYLPTSNSNTPFISLTDLRSLINYINTNPQPISVNTQVIEKITGLYNTNNISSTKIFDFIIGDIYEELNKLVKLDEQRIISEKSSMWSHSIASQLLLLGLGVIV